MAPWNQQSLDWENIKKYDCEFSKSFNGYNGVIAVSLQGSRGCFVNISEMPYNRVSTRENGQGDSFAVLSRECGFTRSKLAVCILEQLSFCIAVLRNLWAIDSKQPLLGCHDKTAQVGLFLQAFRVQHWNNQCFHGTENRQHTIVKKLEIQYFCHVLGLFFGQLKLLVLVLHFQDRHFTSEVVFWTLLAQRGLMFNKEISLQGWYRQSLIQPARRRKNRAQLHASVALTLLFQVIKITLWCFF